jgi:hypothetical protein
MALSRTTRGARVESILQCRVSPATKFVRKRFLGPKEWAYDEVFPVNFDSTLVFPSEKDAMGYFPVFIRQLLEMGLIIKDQPYETAIVELVMFDKEIE